MDLEIRVFKIIGSCVDDSKRGGDIAHNGFF
jgi:hypothetical protein